MSSLQYIDLVTKQLTYETVDQIISNVLMTMRTLIARFIPVEFVAEKKDALFDTLISILGKEGVSKDPIVDQLFALLSSQTNLMKAIEWMDNSKINVDGQDLYELNKNQKGVILRKTFASREFTPEQKQELLQKIAGDDMTDKGERLRATCNAALPDAAVKAQIWADITNPASTDSLYVKSAKMGGFYNWEQLDLIEPYFEKFYEILPELHEKYTFKEFDTFFFSLLPSMTIRDSHIVKLVELKLQVSDNEKMFANTLQDGIEILMRSQRARAFALKEHQANQAKL